MQRKRKQPQTILSHSPAENRVVHKEIRDQENQQAQCTEDAVDARKHRGKRVRKVHKEQKPKVQRRSKPEDDATTSGDFGGNEAKSSKELDVAQLQAEIEANKHYQITVGQERWREIPDIVTKMQETLDLSAPAMQRMKKIREEFYEEHRRAISAEKERCEMVSTDRVNRKLGQLLLALPAPALKVSKEQRKVLEELSTDVVPKTGQPVATTLLTKEKRSEFTALLATCFASPNLQAQERAMRKQAAKNAQNVTQRPDTKALSAMIKRHGDTNNMTRLGHVPGVAMGDRAYLRAEMVATKQHQQVMGGISTVSTSVGRVADAVCCSGGYPENNDRLQSIEYQGEGGNDTLGDKGMLSDQKFSRGNLALMRNIYLNVPVRVYHKQAEAESFCGSSFTYSGLYHVVSYKMESRVSKSRHHKATATEFKVILFHLQRLPGQPNLPPDLTPAEFRKTSDSKRIGVTCMRDVVCLDVTMGKHGKQCALPAVNGVDHELPPCCTLASLVEHQQLKGVAPSAAVAYQRAQGTWQPTLEYLTENVWTDGVSPPQAATLQELFRMRPELAGAEAHDIVTALNCNRLPYVAVQGPHLSLLSRVGPIIYECGDWTGCQLGDDCPLRRSQKPSGVSLILKRLPGRGWGLVTTKFIPENAYICTYVGEVKRIAHSEGDAALHQVNDSCDTYSFDIGKRSDYTWNWKYLDAAQQDPEPQEAKYMIDASRKGNLGRWINHDCQPNAFIQPVLANTLDVDKPDLCFFAGRNIRAWEEITFDYDSTQMIDNQGRCICTSCKVAREADTVNNAN